jgi:hypothetical protein
MPLIVDYCSKNPPLFLEVDSFAATRPPWDTTFVFYKLFVFITPEVSLRAYQLAHHYAPIFIEIQAYASIVLQNMLK